MKVFEANNNVKYNVGSVVFEIKPPEADLWVICFTKRFGDPSTHENESLVFKPGEFRLPNMNSSIKTNYGSITITVWPKPKTTTPKIMIQGKNHLAFVTFAIPLVLRDMNSVRNVPSLAAPAMTPTDSCLAEDSDDESGQKVQISNDSFNQALGRLEQEVLGMRNDLVGRLEATVNNSPSDKRFQALEKLLKENIEQN